MPTTPTHACPAGCGRLVPDNQFACRADWLRLPFALRQPISATYRRDPAAHAQAMQTARAWYREHPSINDAPASGLSISEQLQDMANVLSGTGRHADHDRRQLGRCVVCECGVRVQGTMAARPAQDTELPLFDVEASE
ncbi:hypothetical protein [Actinophytocola sediminis]